MKIVFDLDGVIRDLTGGIKSKYNIPESFPVDTWHWSYKGQNIFDYIAKDLTLLEKCPPTEYFKVIKKRVHKPVIWTSQPRNWLPYTINWIEKHFKFCDVQVFNNPVEKYHCLFDHKRHVLVEDYPNFPDYSRIVLIDRPYNKETNAKLRVTTPAQLNSFLERYAN